MRRYAFGTLRLLPDQFYRMTFAEYSATCEGYELARQQELAPLRHFTAAICQSNGAKVLPTQLVPLPLLDKVDKDEQQAVLEKTLNLARQLKKQRNGRVKG